MDSFYNGFASVCKAARTIFGRTGDMRHGTSHRKQKSITALCLALLLLASGTPVRSQQRVYFVDGYHGGIYGHYPVAWKTRFITDQLAAHPEWRIGLEIEPETWDTVEVRTPADYARFKAIAADRRVEFTNPSYAQPYCYNISGESIIRQFGYGMRKIRSHFPDVEFVTYSVEEPCFTSCLPQILKLYGFKYASLKCPAGAGTRRPTAANWSTGSAPTAVRSSLRRAMPAKSSRKTRCGRPRHGAMRRSTSTPASHTASPTPWGCATRMRDGNTAPGSGRATASATTRSTSRGGSISNG